MQHEITDSNGRSTGARWVLALAVVVLIFGAALRLGGLDRIGLKGSDNTYYTNMAMLWSEGEHVYSIGDSPLLYYRPVVYWVYAAAVRALGFNDATIKTVNTSLDTLNILLVFLLAYILSRKDPWAASSAAVIYALLPFTILISRSELTHTLSTATLLIATILLSLSWFAKTRTIRLVLAFLSGAATGLCALTHEEMIFTAAAPVLFLLLRPGDRNSGVRSRLIAATSLAGSYLIGIFAVAHGMLQTHQADAQVRAAGIIGHRISQSHYLRFIERPLKFAWNALTGSSSTFLACLVIALVLVLVVRWVLNLRTNRSRWRVSSLSIDDLPLWTVALHILFYACFFNYYAVRLFVPLIPLVIVWLVVRSASLATRYAGRHAAHGVLSVLTITVATANLGHFALYPGFVSSRFPTWAPFSLAADVRPDAGWSLFQLERTRKGWARKRWEELGPAVNENSRLLVGASAFHPFPGRRLLQIGYYFGDNSVYLVDQDRPLGDVIEANNIEFVLFTSYQTEDWQDTRGLESRRYLGGGSWSSRVPFTPGGSLGFAEGDYTIQGEFDRLRNYLTRRGARIILGHRDLLERVPSGTDPVSYVVWVLDPKNWPPLEHELEVVSRSLELASQDRLDDALATIDAAGTAETDNMGRFRLRLTAAQILAEHDLPGQARRWVADALAELPRNTMVSTILREAYPTKNDIETMYALFADLQAAKPRDRAVRDLLLWLALVKTEFGLESGNPTESVEAFQTIEGQLRRHGSRKATLAMVDWCTVTSRELARKGRSAEAQAGFAAAASATREIRIRDAMAEGPEGD